MTNLRPLIHYSSDPAAVFSPGRPGISLIGIPACVHHLAD
jgi:hypothetical protein